MKLLKFALALVFSVVMAGPVLAQPLSPDQVPPDAGFESDTRITAPTQTVPMTQTKRETGDPVAVIETSKGVIAIRLFREYAPNTVANFEELVQKGFYNGLTFHRREPGFVVQGGCPNGDGSGNYIDPQTNQPRFIKLELNPALRHNAAGVVAMARSNHPDSASCQFYITLAAAPHLDSKYAVFGGVIKGMDVVHRLAIGDRIISARIQQ